MTSKMSFKKEIIPMKAKVGKKSITHIVPKKSIKTKTVKGRKGKKRVLKKKWIKL